MANVYLQDSTLTSIADAIRSKLQVSTTYRPGQMASAIQSIPSGGGGDTSSYSTAYPIFGERTRVTSTALPTNMSPLVKAGDRLICMVYGGDYLAASSASATGIYVGMYAGGFKRSSSSTSAFVDLSGNKTYSKSWLVEKAQNQIGTTDCSPYNCIFDTYSLPPSFNNVSQTPLNLYRRLLVYELCITQDMLDTLGVDSLCFQVYASSISSQTLCVNWDVIKGSDISQKCSFIDFTQIGRKDTIESRDLALDKNTMAVGCRGTASRTLVTTYIYTPPANFTTENATMCLTDTRNYESVWCAYSLKDGGYIRLTDAEKNTANITANFARIKIPV